jgi:hypothetical protein
VKVSTAGGNRPLPTATSLRSTPGTAIEQAKPEHIRRPFLLIGGECRTCWGSIGTWRTGTTRSSSISSGA